MKYITLILVLAFSINLNARERINFNEDWKFKLNDQPGAEASSYDDSGWRVLDLPHDWSIEGEYSDDNPMSYFCGYLPAGISWYRKTIEVPDEWKGKHVEIAFDGVFMNSTVWANGQKLGFRPYGWISFSYLIPEEILQSGKITFAVRVENEKQPSGRWYTGSGIYANTWIDIKEKVHVANGGIYIRTEGSRVDIDTEISNLLPGNTKAELVTSIKDPAGQVVATVRNKLKLEVSGTSITSQNIKLNKPALWSVETPNLYTVVTEVRHAGKTFDRIETRFGVRDIEWVPETGMWINGKNVKLQGVCNHQDGGAFGAAVPDKIMRFRLQQMKDMGCNAIRTSHNPFRPQFYDMCDEMGMMVMDEIFDGWYRKAENDYGAHAFDDWWEKDLGDWIRRDRNHPSIVIWSVGNETKGDEIGRKLVEACHSHDPTRPVTSGHAAPDVMDVLGVNGGSERKDWIKEHVPDRVFIGTENTHTLQARGYYRTKTWYRNGYPSERQNPHYYPDLTEEEVFTYDWISDEDRPTPRHILHSSYDNATIRLNVRHNIELLRDVPYFAGTFRWTGYDYLGESKYHGGWPFKALSAGAIDLANFEKDLYYLYQSQWTEKSMAHILPHWTHPTLEEGTEIPVWVYSNCDEVELFFNGESLGRIKPGRSHEDMQCQWMVGWKPGTLKAVAYKDGKAVVTKTVSTADAPARISLSVDGEPLAGAKGDIVQVRVSTTDKNGVFYPYGENRTWFHVIGSGKVRALDNGSPMDTEKHFEATSRNAFFGLTRAYIESTDEDGDISLLASCILGEKKQVTSNLVSIDTDLITLRGKPAKADIAIYYTTDGSNPTMNSPSYEGPFEVDPGTTVKALVLLNGEPVHVLKERFAADEGIVFNAGAYEKQVAGDQAENAKYEGAAIGSEGKGFRGKGYLCFEDEENAFVEWFYENDGAAGEFWLKVRYRTSGGKKDYKALLNVNGQEKTVTFPATGNNRDFWKAVEAPFGINAGANTIRLTPVKAKGLCIDELLVY